MNGDVMFPVRAPATVRVPTAGGVKTVPADSPLAGLMCPACGESLCEPGEDPVEVLLVVVGVEPESQKAAGWTSAGTVPVHRDCVPHHYDANAAGTQQWERLSDKEDRT